MAGLSQLWFAIFFLFPIQHKGVLDSVQVSCDEVMAEAGREGLPWLISKLDEIAARYPSASTTPRILETIQQVALLHPGSVPDHETRFEKMKQQAASNPDIDKIVKRLEILRVYFLGVAEEPPKVARIDTSDPSLEGSMLTALLKADMAFRRGDLDQAEQLAEQVVEADPFSPFNANAFVLLGLSQAYRGNAQRSADYLQKAVNVTPLPTLYGRTQDYLAIQFRFVQRGANPAGNPFEETIPTRIAGASPLKDPRSLQGQGDRFTLVDREQTIVLSVEGKVIETKTSRRIEDLVLAGSGKTFYLAEDFIDFGMGSPTRISLTVGGKPRPLNKLQSMSLNPEGDIYILDQDHGLLVGKVSRGTSISVTQMAPLRGRMIRVDRRGYILILSADQKSVSVLTREGKMLTSLAPTIPSGKEPAIEYFALDLLNNVYLMDSTSNSIQIFALSTARAGLEKSRIATISLEPRPYYKNLRVLSVSSTGEIVATGKNEDYWILFR